MAAHLRVMGVSRAHEALLDEAAERGGAAALAVRCHRRLRGPYTGVDTVLRVLLPDAAARWPELVEQHRVELLYGMPELAELIGPAPRTLASDSAYTERTRFYGSPMIRCMSQGIVTFLLEHARRTRAEGRAAPVLVFEEVDAAEPTTQEFLALLVRRADPGLLHIVVCDAGGGGLPEELETALERCAERREAAVAGETGADQAQAVGDDARLVEAYIASDGTSDDPRQLRAYRDADPELVARLHDRRADELDRSVDWGVRIAALCYHRERGGDPAGAGRRALLAALRHCVETGFSAMVLDLGLRGRAVSDPVAHEHDYWEFTSQAAAACIPQGRPEEALKLYRELLGRYTTPKIHMITSYSIAMLYTRFFRPRDHELAKQWQNTAIAIAGLLPDPADRLTFGVFQDNAMALIEMHRGELGRALDLVESGIARLDAQLADDEWVLHRSQLLYNRARLLAATGRLDEAFADFSTLIDLDPYYTDYLSERARILRRRGEVGAALADYDRAVRLAPPFPELYYNRGTARMEAGDPQGALEDFDYVLEMEPEDLDTRLARIELLLAAGRAAEAEADVGAALASRPDEPQLLCMKGAILLQHDDRLDEALAAFDRALKSDARYPAALVNRAVVHFRLGRYPDAAADLTETLGLVGDDPDVLLNRGITYLADGRRTLALADFERALELPDADTAALQHHRARCVAEADGPPPHAAVHHAHMEQGRDDAGALATPAGGLSSR